MPDPGQRAPRGVIDTSVVIDLEKLDPAVLPVEVAVSSVTLAELAAGPMPPRTMTSGPAGKTLYNAQRQPLTLSLSTPKPRAPTGGSMQPSPRLATRPGGQERQMSRSDEPIP